jgi:hypothetical protein
MIDCLMFLTAKHVKLISGNIFGYLYQIKKKIIHILSSLFLKRTGLADRNIGYFRLSQTKIQSLPLTKKKKPYK